jgi:hypothetical protein
MTYAPACSERTQHRRWYERRSRQPVLSEQKPRGWVIGQIIVGTKTIGVTQSLHHHIARLRHIDWIQSP